MSRIAKQYVYSQFERAAQFVQSAAKGNGRTSRADMQAALEQVQNPVERDFFDMFFRFVDNRDAAPGAVVTDEDLSRAVAFACKEMVADYDIGGKGGKGNGLSRDEVAKMSRTAKLAVQTALNTEPALARLGWEVIGG